MLLILASICLSLSCGANAQTTASLHTLQTLLKLQAGKEAPRVVSLQSPANQIWTNSDPEKLIDSVEQGGQTLPLHWRLRTSHADARVVTFVYENPSPRLRLTWQWQARADFGPIEHTITIENLSGAEMWLPLQPSFAFQFAANPDEPLQQVYVDKGAGKPTNVGTHEVAAPTGYEWKSRSSTYARDEDEREVIPWFAVTRQNRAQDGWYVGVEFSGRTQLTLARGPGSIYGAVGLNPDPGPFRTRLAPHETFIAPTVFLGAFAGGPDGLGNILRPWVRHVLNNPLTWKDATYPLLVNNSWGSGMQINEGLAQRMLRDSAELGLEMFHIDAGWFRGVGDWYPDPAKFPHGLGAIADEAHQRRLKLGLWVDWAQAGVDPNPGALNAHDPRVRDWLVADVPKDWQPKEFVGRTTDLGFPRARDYAMREVNRIITDYHLDMLEHDGYLVAKNCARSDHPHAVASQPTMSTVPGNGIALPDTSNSTDVSYHAVRAYYDIYASMRQAHPGLLFEVCNDGGRMVDFGSATHGDYFSITDSYDPISNRQAFYDASHLLPAPMLEDYVEKWPTPRIENFRYMLRSGMMGMLTIMQDTNIWTAEEHAAAKAEFALYKQKLRPLIRDADLYHISPRPDGIHWDGMEYFDPRRANGVLYAFHGSVAQEGQHTFALQGLLPGHTYRLHFADHSSADQSATGSELSAHGLTVTLPLPLSSELIFIADTTSRPGEP